MKPLKIIAALLLIFNGTVAIYGGVSLMLEPDGKALGLSLTLLDHAPFNDFLIPGILLFVINGILSLVALSLMLQNVKNYVWLVMLQGFLLSGWIVVQMHLIRSVHSWHVIMLLIGVSLLLIGRLQKKLLTKKPLDMPRA